MANVYIKGVSGGEKATPVVTDAIPLDDGSTSTYALLGNLLKIISGLSADASPDETADYIATVDASDSTPKKVLPNALITDAKLTTTDVTTNNASTTKHGFLAKLPNNYTSDVEGVGGTWSTRRIIKTSTTTIISDSTVNDDPHLVWAIGTGNERWNFLLTLYITAVNATMDFKCNFTYPTGTTILWNAFASQSGSPQSSSGVIATGTTAVAVLTEASTLAFGTLGGTQSVMLHGTVFGATTAGNIQFQWAQNTSDANNLSLLAGSNLILDRFV